MVADCRICEHAQEHGWWGPECRGTHCESCHRSWTGFAECHCRRCCRHFSTVRGFDAHFTASGCADPKAKSGYRLVERASGPTWAVPLDEKALARLKSRTQKAVA